MPRKKKSEAAEPYHDPFLEGIANRDNSLAAWGEVVAEQGSRAKRDSNIVSASEISDSIASAAKAKRRGRPPGIVRVPLTTEQLLQNHIRDVMLLARQHDIPFTQDAMIELLDAKFPSVPITSKRRVYNKLVDEEYIVHVTDGIVQWCMA